MFKSKKNSRLYEVKQQSLGKLPKILLLGDSIRMSYQPLVAEMLTGKAIICGPEENCQFCLYTLINLDRWISDLGKPDIIHWNSGIHDAGHNPYREPEQVPVELYRIGLYLILKRLNKITPHILWASTTPVRPQKSQEQHKWYWTHSDIDCYNNIATELMAENDVPVNDLHKVVSQNVEEFLCEDMIHLSDVGKVACAQAVVSVIEERL